MRGEERRLATLAAAFHPAAAVALLARRDAPGAADLVAYAARLVSAPRVERLRALASVLSGECAARAPAERAAAAERPRVAAVLRAVASGASPGAEVSPALLRLCAERLAG